MCQLHPGLTVKGYGRLPCENGLMDRVSTSEMQQLVTKGFNIVIRQNPLLTLSYIEAGGGEVIFFSFFTATVEFFLTWGFPQDGGFFTSITWILK